MDPLVFEWAYDEEAQATVVTTTTIIHTYFYPGRIHEEVEPNILLTSAVVPEAPLGQLLGPWDFPLSPLPNIEIEPMSPGLPSVEPQP